MVGHIQKFPPHERKLMRNVFTEPVGDLGQCVNGEEAYPMRGDKCISLPVIELGNSGSTSSPLPSIVGAVGMAVAGMML